MKRKCSFTETKSKKLPTKRDITSSLKSVYQIFSAPFVKDDYDQIVAEPLLKSNNVIKVYGSWEEAINKSGLAAKFQKYKQIKAEKLDFCPEKEIKENWKKEKEKLIQKAEDKKVKWLKEQNHKIDILKEMMDESISKANPLTVEITPRKTTKKASLQKERATLWLEFSDLQLGTLITEEELGGINEHNWDIWKKKISIWKTEVLKQIDNYKKIYQLDKIVIACLGDMVEGQNIFRGQGWKIDRHVVDQAIMGAMDTAACFTEIMMLNEDLKFEVLEVFGNHGRIGHKGDSPYSCSMDKVYQRMLEAQLKGVKNLKNYTYHNNESWFYLANIYGWNHLLLHGDQGMSKIKPNKPTVDGLEKGIVQYNQMFQQQVHFLHCGHFHTPINWSFNSSQILVNGSFIGTSDFAATQMVASSPPVQMMYIFKPRCGLDSTHRIYLTDNNVINPIKPKVV